MTPLPPEASHPASSCREDARRESARPTSAGEAKLHLDGGFRTVPRYHRADLRPGDMLEGPLVVEEPSTRLPIVVLHSKRDRRTLALAIGQFEANGIAIALQGVTPPRPLTHDLFLNVLGDLRASLKRIVVTDLRDELHALIVVLT